MGPKHAHRAGDNETWANLLTRNDWDISKLATLLEDATMDIKDILPNLQAEEKQLNFIISYKDTNQVALWYRVFNRPKDPAKKVTLAPTADVKDLRDDIAPHIGDEGQAVLTHNIEIWQVHRRESRKASEL